MAVISRRTRDVIYVWLYVTILACDVTYGLKNGRRPTRINPDDVDIHIGREQKLSRHTGRKLVVTTVLDAPYMMMKPYSMGSFITGNDMFEGYMADIIRNLSLSIGFEYVIRLSLDGKYGEPDLDNNWNGMIGEIQRGEADIAIGALTVTPERAEVVDFTDPFMTFRSTAVLKKPRKRGRRQRIETSEDLLQSDVIYGVVDGSIVQRVMRTSVEPQLRGMWARMVNFWPTPFVQSIQEGIERTRREKYAFIVDTPLAEYLIGTEPCDLHAIEPFLDTRRYAMAMRRDDVLINEINTQLRIINERQILSEFYLKWWRSSCDLYLPRDDRNTETTTAPTKSANEQGQIAHYESRGSYDSSSRLLVMASSLCACLLSFNYSHHITRTISTLDT